MFDPIRVTTHHANGETEHSTLRPSAQTATRFSNESAPHAEVHPIDALRAPDQSFWQPQRFERVRTVLERRSVRAAGGLVVLLAFGATWLAFGGGATRGSASNAQSTSGKPLPAGAASEAASTTQPVADKSGRITVHVAGLVARPGVITLPAGARVIDALEAVGGATRDADLTSINLAATLRDGTQIVVAKPGVAVSSAAASHEAIININTASPEQLESLPGIGPTLASAIVREREQRGPYRSAEDLQRVSGLGARRIADLKARIAV
ncbi:MAG: helix-hairpin-helix domain-containing protein [Acidimicrobiia bacterium]